MAIQYYTDGVKLPKIEKRRTSTWIKQVAELHNKRCGDISYIFCNDEKILEVNNQYLQHDYYTDIITFDYSTQAKISGDLFISLDTVLSNSQKFAQNYERELLRVIIHGVLHLCGIKDKQPHEREEMELAENQALDIYYSDSENSK